MQNDVLKPNFNYPKSRDYLPLYNTLSSNILPVEQKWKEKRMRNNAIQRVLNLFYVTWNCSVVTGYKMWLF